RSSVDMTHLRLQRAEIDTLRSLPSSHRNKSGFANFIFRLGQRVDPNTGSITLSRPEIKRIQKYIKRYRSGGYQLMLRKAFNGHSTCAEIARTFTRDFSVQPDEPFG